MEARVWQDRRLYRILMAPHSSFLMIWIHFTSPSILFYCFHTEILSGVCISPELNPTTEREKGLNLHWLASITWGSISNVANLQATCLCTTSLDYLRNGLWTCFCKLKIWIWSISKPTKANSVEKIVQLFECRLHRCLHVRLVLLPLICLPHSCEVQDITRNCTMMRWEFLLHTALSIFF